MVRFLAHRDACDAPFPARIAASVIVFPHFWWTALRIRGSWYDQGARAPKIEQGASCRSSALIRWTANPGITDRPIRRTTPAERFRCLPLVYEVAPFVRDRTSPTKAGYYGLQFRRVSLTPINFFRHRTWSLRDWYVRRLHLFKMFLDGYYERAYAWPWTCGTADGYRLSEPHLNYHVLAVGSHDPLFDQNVKWLRCFGKQGIRHLLSAMVGGLRARLARGGRDMARKFFVQ